MIIDFKRLVCSFSERDNMSSSIPSNLPPKQAWLPFRRQNPLRKARTLRKQINLNISDRASWYFVLLQQKQEVEEGHGGDGHGDQPGFDEDKKLIRNSAKEFSKIDIDYT